MVTYWLYRWQRLLCMPHVWSLKWRWLWLQWQSYLLYHLIINFPLCVCVMSALILRMTGLNYNISGPMTCLGQRGYCHLIQYLWLFCNVMLYNVDDFIGTQIHTQIGYVQSDVHEFSTTVRSILLYVLRLQLSGAISTTLIGCSSISVHRPTCYSTYVTYVTSPPLYENKKANFLIFYVV